MFEYIFSLWGMIIVAIVCGTLYSIIDVAIKQYRKSCDTAIEGALKEEMIKQGRSVEEIERILKATGKPSKAAEES